MPGHIIMSLNNFNLERNVAMNCARVGCHVVCSVLCITNFHKHLVACYSIFVLLPHCRWWGFCALWPHDCKAGGLGWGPAGSSQKAALQFAPVQCKWEEPSVISQLEQSNCAENTALKPKWFPTGSLHCYFHFKFSSCLQKLYFFPNLRTVFIGGVSENKCEVQFYR